MMLNGARILLGRRHSARDHFITLRRISPAGAFIPPETERERGRKALSPD